MANLLKDLDANQVIRSVYDPNENCLRVCVVEGTTGDGGGFEVIISHTSDSIRLGDGTQLVTATLVGSKVGLDVNVINEVDIEDLDSSKDNVAIKDSSGNELDINTDGSITVGIGLNADVNGLYKYGEVLAVASGVETTLVTHTAVGGRQTFLQKVNASGDNIAKYKVKINGTTIDFQRTNFGSDLNVNFIFDGELTPGIELDVGDVVSVTVLHQRGGTADFNSKILYTEVI